MTEFYSKFQESLLDKDTSNWADWEPKVGPVAREAAQHARLVGGAGAAATQHQGQVIRG